MFRWVDHTAELELEIEAPTEEGVFADALAALAELLASQPEDETRVRRHISVDAEDRPALLAAWMEELVFLAETDGFEPLAVETLELGPSSAAGDRHRPAGPATTVGQGGHIPPAFVPARRRRV